MALVRKLIMKVERMPNAPKERNSIYYNKGILQDACAVSRILVKHDDCYKVLALDSVFDLELVFTKSLLEREGGLISIDMAKGWYDYCILESNPNTIFINEVCDDARFGHTSITMGLPVILAGEVLFGGGEYNSHLPPGLLDHWNNKSGHYQVGSRHEYKLQSKRKFREKYFLARIPNDEEGNPILPIDRFQLWYGDL